MNSRVLITEGPSNSDRISSLGSDEDAGCWNGERVNESQIQSTLPGTPLITNLISGPEKIARIVRDMIPEFTGKNMSIKLFLKYCKTVISMANFHDAPYLTMLILNKMTGEARKHIQDKSELKLEDVLKTLERIYSQEEDVSQMLQALSNIQKNPEESIQEYRGRINQLLNKLTSQVMENTPREKGIGQCEAYKETVIGNFLRGLDPVCLGSPCYVWVWAKT